MSETSNHCGQAVRVSRSVSSLDLRPMVFHVKPAEAAMLERALKRFGGPRRRRGAALAAAVRAGVANTIVHS